MNKKTTISVATIAIVLAFGITMISPATQSGSMHAGLQPSSDVYGEVVELSEARSIMNDKMITLPSNEHLKMVLVDEEDGSFVTLIYDDNTSSKMSVSGFPDATLVIESSQHEVNPLLGLEKNVRPITVSVGGKVIDTIPQGPTDYTEIKVGNNSGVFIKASDDNRVNLLVWWDENTEMLHKISADKTLNELVQIASTMTNS